jgi:hypothetical protein
MVIMPKSAACHQTTGDRVAGDFAIIEVLFGASCPEFVRKWWNYPHRLAILYRVLIINLLPFASITSENVPRNGQ